MVSEVDERWVTRTSGADEFKPRKGAVKQELVLQALKQGDLRVAELTAEYGSVSATLKSLEKKGVIRIEHRRRMRECDQPSAAFSKRAGERPVLTPHQEEALAAITWASAKQDGHVVLVDGVTGSGKTEVYLRAIENELEQGRGAIVLVPEISLTPQTGCALSRSFRRHQWRCCILACRRVSASTSGILSAKDVPVWW